MSSSKEHLKFELYSIAFGYPNIYGLRAFDVAVEILFLLDIFRSNHFYNSNKLFVDLLTEYQDA
jgi:hypothetical protein